MHCKCRHFMCTTNVKEKQCCTSVASGGIPDVKVLMQVFISMIHLMSDSA